MPNSLLPYLDIEIPDLAVTSWKEVVHRAWERSQEIDTQRLNYNKITDQYHDDWHLLHRYEFDQFYNAWVGVAFRFRACGIHNQSFTESFERTTGAPQGKDLYQEDDALFDFFVKSLSALETFYYSLYALGALIYTPINTPSVPPPAQFPLLDPTYPKNLGKIKLVTTFDTFSKEFSNLPLTELLGQIREDQTFKELSLIRNALAHRLSSARRTLQYGGSLWFEQSESPLSVKWAGDLPLDNTTTASRYSWLRETLNRALEETAAFTVKQLPFVEKHLRPLV
jgi:hypothetical protein